MSSSRITNMRKFRKSKYSKTQNAIQEASTSLAHLRKSRAFLLPRLNAQNEWTETRKVMKEVQRIRVSLVHSMMFWHLVENPEQQQLLRMCNAVKERDNCLEATLGHSMKRVLNPVVEVQYTTARVSVAR